MCGIRVAHFATKVFGQLQYFFQGGNKDFADYVLRKLIYFQKYQVNDKDKISISNPVLFIPIIE